MSREAELEARVMELEIRVSFQDQLLHDLDEVVRALRSDLERVRQEHLSLVDSLDAHRGPAVDEKPPHY
jgi:uncharacterized coiled-coil protein SlyX